MQNIFMLLYLVYIQDHINQVLHLASLIVNVRQLFCHNFRLYLGRSIQQTFQRSTD